MANFSAASLAFIEEHTWHCVLHFPPQPQVHVTRFSFRLEFKLVLWASSSLAQSRFLLVWATTFLSDASQLEVDFLNSSAVILIKFLGKSSLQE